MSSYVTVIFLSLASRMGRWWLFITRAWPFSTMLNFTKNHFAVIEYFIWIKDLAIVHHSTGCFIVSVVKDLFFRFSPFISFLPSHRPALEQSSFILSGTAMFIQQSFRISLLPTVWLQNGLPSTLFPNCYEISFFKQD